MAKSGKSSTSPSSQESKRIAGDPPIAVIGMACRFPGAPDIPSFWRLLENGGNSISEGISGAGAERMGELFPGGVVPNEACRFGSFVADIDQFDASFFRISPAEAQLMDPQQRMMLETSWQALEDAGIDPDQLKGGQTGVYTGISNDEYRMLVLDTTKPTEAAGCLYALSGTNLNGASGRVSFVLGLMGPAKAVDAACASSLVSVHDAVVDLQQGKADLAIAGGVQALLNGRVYELRADAMMLSPDGQCKTFDASANGYVRGEGCGVVILKRLSEAEADGDRIWGVIRSSAVNHGGASVGLTVPNTPALEQVIETALSQAGIPASDVDYLEAHGTGTTVGDPIEINAVASVYGKDREADHPLLVGSVKTNVGHLESAAGVAGLIKAVLAVERGVIPKHLHFQDPHPGIDWDHLPLQITSSTTDWPRHRGRPRLAGVNSFGISGTNAHIVVEEYDGPSPALGEGYRAAGSEKAVEISLPATVADLPLPEQEKSGRKSRLLPLSGKSEDALRNLAKRYLSWLDDRAEESSENIAMEPLLSDMAWTAGVGRSHFDCRAGIVFRDTESLRERLKDLAEADDGIKPGMAAKVAFAYTGQGSQWAGMGQALYEHEPIARAVLDRCEAAFQDERGTSLLDVMFGRAEGEGELEDTAWEQPALYALECALTALWASLGIRPSVVVGHSVGELAAAQAAGVFSLEDGMRFAATRGALLSGTEPGAMAAVFAPAEQVTSEVETFNASSSNARLSVSGYNGTHQVISGPIEEIEAISKHLESEGIRVKRLNTARAFHSALVEPALDALEASLKGIAIKSPSLTVVSNLTGQAVGSDELLDGAYWRRHAREPVAFARGAETLAELGMDLVLEIGPRSVLAPMAAAAWPESAQAPAVLSSLRPPSGNGKASGSGSDFAEAVAEAYQAGLPIHFPGLFTGETRRRISLPGYPFQRERHWVEASKRRHLAEGHPLLGVRHESANGEITFETEIFPSDPTWLSDHRVFGRLIAPGALYGAMAASASLAEGGRSMVVEDLQLHNPLIFSNEKTGEGEEESGRKVQVVLDAPEQAPSQRVRIFSKGSEEGWVKHIEGRVSPGTSMPEDSARIDVEKLKSDLSPADVSAYYSAKSATGIDLGPFFRTLGKVWSGPGEALGEVRLPESLGRNELDVHPLVLDGCFQVVGVARNMTGAEGEATYLPFGWERLWLAKRLPDRVLCHVSINEAPGQSEEKTGQAPEVLSGELRIYDPDGVLLGGLSGYTVKRATRAALLSAVEGVKDLLYEVVWRDCALGQGITPADFFPDPSSVAARTGLFSEYVAAAGVKPEDRNSLLMDLEQWSRSYALTNLEKLGWQREVGTTVDPDELRQRLGVNEDHKRLFRRLFEMLAKSGVLEETEEGFTVVLGPEDPLPDELPDNPEEFHTRMAELYPHGSTEIGLFRRSGGALAEVLRGQEDPLTLLFSSGEPTAADLYLKAPVARAANQLLADAVRMLVAALPEGRRLKVIEVGAGTGSATASVLPELPQGRFDYTYTDISAGFFSEAEGRFGDAGGCIEYRPLDIEKDPIDQGFNSHGYDLLIASNVLHATRHLDETLGHCRDLLAPSGQLIALENLHGQGWMDLTFGQLDGWWRFADDYRPHHALASPAVWRQALGNSGFGEVEVLGVDESDEAKMPDKGVIVARGPVEVAEPPGVWVLTASDGDKATELAGLLAARNQTVVLAGSESSDDGQLAAGGPGVFKAAVEMDQRESWQSLLESLPREVPLNGVVHLAALDGRGTESAVEEMAEDVKQIGASALALVQGLTDADVTPEKGVWFVTRGAQVLERERGGALAGATLWGFGKVVAQEAAHLQPRMVDLDPAEATFSNDFLNELLYPDPENHIAYRLGDRLVARLVRFGTEAERLVLPEESDWVLSPDPGGIFEKPEIKLLPERTLEPKEVRVTVEATGLNFWDVFRSLGFIEEGNLGRELCGYVLEVGSDVSTVSVGDRVVGLGFGAFGPEMITREELVAQAPPGVSVSALATIPSAFVSAALSYELSGLEAGDRVLIHAGAGGVGLAAIQLANAAGAEVFATASAPKQAYLRSLGVEHVFDSRQTAFGKEILEVTDGAGVDVVLNCLTGEGFIDASLSCLAKGGRFVELARRDILSKDEMAAARPDVAYDILELDVLKKTDPAWVGRVLDGVMEQFSSGKLTPIVHSRWPLAEGGAALRFMRSARHLGKIVLTPPALMRGQLRQDRTYLVTGGLGGIGCAVAEWLAGQGAGAIVLNGRRDPDAAAEETINALRERGITVQVELADVLDAAAVDQMLARIDQELPPLGGVIHSVGVLSDAALTNQSWESFEKVLWPKILGAWHLHRATVNRDLDLFVLFSSRVGVMGNPGQANHAAANAFLDQLAGHRRALGLPGQAIAWGAWSEIGEAAEQRERIERRRAALGGRWFTPQQGIKALENLVRQDTTTSVVMAMDWTVFEEATGTRPPLLEDLLSVASDNEAEAAAPSGDLLSQLRGAPAAAHEGLLVSFLQQEVQAVLRLPSAPAPTVGFFDLGMDSLMAVELRNRLNRAFSEEYTASNTVVFDYPDITTLAGHLAEEVGDVGSAPAPQAQPEPEPERQPVEQREDDGIAIVGMACRFPGAPDLSSFWRVLEAGEDMVTDGRQDVDFWGDLGEDFRAKYAAYCRGGFVEGLDKFDSRFFGIRPIEARTMDPRQRLLLETSWQALEDAGMDPALLKGSQTGVYVGLGGSEYRDLVAALGEEDNYIGTAGSVAAGRISYALGFMGPAIPLDMTCASSLVAVHQAAASLQRGEVDLALAGGANVVLSPSVTKFMADFGMLSASGRCRVFDTAADGFVRGEGCGIVVLKRLSRAEADGDRIWGVIRGSAVNQNGASAGISAPSGTAQEQVLGEALAQTGIPPSEVDYLEAHGTGSALGDPVEVRAAAAVYGKGREADRPLLIGSVKPSIGHLEWAAGVSALIKVVLAMQRRKIPGQLHFQNPSPQVDWDQLPVRVTSETTDWPLDPDRPPRAGVSAFGLSGTNAHVIVEGYDAPQSGPYKSNGMSAPKGAEQTVDISLPESVADSLPAAGEFDPRAARILPLSGKSHAALEELAGEYRTWLDDHAEELSEEGEDPDRLLADMAWTAGIGRSHFTHRAGVVFSDTGSLRDGLGALVEAGEGSEPRVAAKAAFVYTGQDSQWVGMGEALYRSEPVIRAVLDQCDAWLQEEREVSLLDVMFGRADSKESLDDPAWAQPAIYALECALTAWWLSMGVRPSAVIGHDLGEVAAAQAAGVFSLKDGLLFAAARGTDELEVAFSGIAAAPPSITLISSTMGRTVGPDEILDATHWREQASKPVELQKCAEALSGFGIDGLVEIGPREAFGPMLASAWPESAGDAGEPALISSLHEPSADEPVEDIYRKFVRAVAEVYEAGLPISFQGLFAGEARHRISLPGYPFQRRRHWIKTSGQ